MTEPNMKENTIEVILRSRLKNCKVNTKRQMKLIYKQKACDCRSSHRLC